MDNISSVFNGQLLSYGISGFALMMIGLTYYQIRIELNRDEPRKIAIKTIWMFMGLVLLSITVVGVFSVPTANKNEDLKAQVDSLTINISELVTLITNYEYAMNELAYKLDRKTNPKTSTHPPLKPPRNIKKGGKSALDLVVVGRYFDFKKLNTSNPKKKIKLNDSIRKNIIYTSNLKLMNYNIKTLPEKK